MRRWFTSYRFAGYVLSLGTVFFLASCAGRSEHVVIKDGQGSVSLTEFSTHGSTGRYPGSLQPIKASHPIALSHTTIARVLSGIEVGIIPTDSSGDSKGIKPVRLFSASEVAALAPSIAGALKQARPGEYVSFQVGTDPETTDCSLYVDGPAIRIILNRYRSVSRRRDESLSIYTLSFSPDSATLPTGHVSNWIEETATHPWLAVAYRQLAVLDAPHQSSPASTAPRTPEPAQGGMQDMKATMEKQAQELDALKTELDLLKKQLQSPSVAPKGAP